MDPTIRQKRIFIGLLCIALLLFALVIRLLYVQLVASRSLTDHKVDLVANSVLQREGGMILDSGRGDFYDRNGYPLTGNPLKVLVVFPVEKDFRGNREQIASLSNILHIHSEEWERFVAQLDIPKIWTGPSADIGASSRSPRLPVQLTEPQMAQIESLHLPNLRIAEYKQRYTGNQLARHVIGFIGQNPDRITQQFVDQFHKGELQLTSKIGGAGLEKTLEPWLQGIGPTSISLFTDAQKRPLDGLASRMVSPNNEYYPVKAFTTLNADIQQRIETMMDKLHIKEGSVVVLDAANADVVAMASRPQFDPQQIDLTTGDWANRALKATIPGSIFKTVVAAAALEEKAASPDEVFDCEGALGKYGFTCWKKDGHGLITFREAFAESCNIVFGKLMERLNGEQLEQYARKLGLDARVGWSGTFAGQSGIQQWDAEEGGQIFAQNTPKNDQGVLMQSAIGQRDVRVTPLQAANMVVTLLNKGEVKSPRIVESLRFQNGRLMDNFALHTLASRSNGISAETAGRLLEWMNDVVDHGTATALQQAKWHLAGKSGTGQVTTGPGETDNQWFIGYGPVEQPKYAVAVVAENVPLGAGNKSLSLFKEVMNVLADQ
ncbi:penicillin-binding protein 2 [Paenibacillus thalictri]|uniref:Penicillin-binding protein 2 n=1 Tax=Paenibacillus thalictri TaxID=2527873 RepID=A0A4Q9DZD7_9BACL|nr:penicillin-binding protein 2 [Paenibacillus thalictri]